MKVGSDTVKDLLRRTVDMDDLLKALAAIRAITQIPDKIDVIVSQHRKGRKKGGH